MVFREDYENYYSVEKLIHEFGSQSQKERVDLMLSFSEGSILDVGAGTGNLMKKARFIGRKVEGVELSEHLYHYLRGEGLKVKRGDARKLPYKDNSFDTVTLGEILEHLPNPGKALSEAFRVAKNRVTFSVPLGDLNDDWHYWNIGAAKVNNFLVVTFAKKEDLK